MVKNEWQKGLTVSALFLDVKGAFPRFDIDRLADNMRAKGIRMNHTDWMMRRRDGRKTRPTFDDSRSHFFDIEGGRDQGNTLSGITYLLYNP
jgi:hypothetical protein